MVNKQDIENINEQHEKEIKEIMHDLETISEYLLNGYVPSDDKTDSNFDLGYAVGLVEFMLHKLEDKHGDDY
jgi:protein subunit release factor A